jgi:uncharacterized membrane protein YfcA
MAIKPNHLERETGQAVDPSLRLSGAIGFLSGIVIGAAAGLIGVGGGEFRIPVLLHILRLPVKEAAGANTIIGFFVVVLSVARRWGQQRLTADDLTLGAVMTIVSILGAVIGARQAHRLSTPFLKRVICVYLLAVGVRMIAECSINGTSLPTPGIERQSPRGRVPCSTSSRILPYNRNGAGREMRPAPCV